MKAFPTKRVRFVTHRGLTATQRQLLANASTVAFVPMEMVGDRGQVLEYGERDIGDVGTGYSRFFEGDVVIAKITPCFENGKGAVVSGMPVGVGFGTTELHVLTPHESIDARFLCYVTAGPDFRLKGAAFMVGAAGQKRVTEDFVRDFPCPVPPLDTQRAIADHLDRETARIDGLVAAKERVLELMAEKRRALIAQAVTRGLDPKVPLRDSGVPWLGEVPGHWGIARSKWLFTERDERSVDGSEVLLSLRMEKGLVPHNDVSDKPTTPEELVGYKKASVGEIVVNRMRAASGLIAITPQEGLVSPDYAVYRVSEAVAAEYYTHLFKTRLLQGVFRSESTGLGTGSSGFLRLYSESFLSLWFPFPPLSEQHAIVAHIAKETAKLGALRVATEKTILLLKERRGALISAAVTGQMDMQEHSTV